MTISTPSIAKKALIFKEIIRISRADNPEKIQYPYLMNAITRKRYNAELATFAYRLKVGAKIQNIRLKIDNDGTTITQFEKIEIAQAHIDLARLFIEYGDFFPWPAFGRAERKRS